MSELVRVLDAFHRGEIGYEALDAAVEARLEEDPRSAAEIVELLGGAAGDSLPRDARKALAAKIRRHQTGTVAQASRGANAQTRDGDTFRPLDTGFMLRGDADTTGGGTEPTRAASATTGGFPAPSADGSPELGEADILRGRFELIAKLGEGGMGAVWKGKDLLKEEAKDRNPYVAIKLLQRNFKEHPDAFIALQRETAKQQRLAHPNVATVFSFDRDTDSGAVFMSMDLLEGESLDAFIHAMPEGGLDEAEAMSIIQQIAAGLAYAHKNGLVHSDLKPGNCFLTNDGTVKLLDFGIARASKTKVDAEGVTTLFDPAELGAITPAYATVEMFEGEQPDPRDDIYALGIMAYQLLTGRHPYDKMSAPRAREMGLVPEPVPKLSKRQNRGLARALALDRRARTPSVDQFIDDIQRPRNMRIYGIAASLVAFAVIAVLAYAQIVDFVRSEENETIIGVLERGGVENIAEGLSMMQALESDDQRRDLLKDTRTRDAVIRHIQSGGRNSVREALALIRPLDAAWQQDILDHPEARETIIRDYDQRIDAAFDPENGLYDFARASDLANDLAALYPNSASVVNIRTKIADRHAQELERLTKSYDELLDKLRTSTEYAGEGIGEILRTIRALDPANPALNDPRLADAIATQTRIALVAGDVTRAKTILDLADALASSDATIVELRAQLAAKLELQRQDNLAVELHARLARERTKLNTLADFRRMQDDLMLLASLRPQDTMLNDLRWQLKQIFVSEFEESIAEMKWQEAEGLLVDFARFFDIPYIDSQRKRLDDSMKADGARIPATVARRDELARRAKVINEKLREPLLTPEWESEFDTAFKESLAMIGADGSGVALIRRTMMLLYRDRALEAIKARQYVRARNLISKGRDYLPGASELDAVDAMLAKAQQAVLMKEDTNRRKHDIEQAKQALLAHAAAGRLDEAELALKALAAKLPEDDPFITETARPAVASAFVEGAARSRSAGDLDAAIRQLERALEVAPSRDTERALEELTDERARAVLTASLSKAMESGNALDVPALSADIAVHRQRYPEAHEAFLEELAALATARLLVETNGLSFDGQSLRRELDDMHTLFPERFDSIRDEVRRSVEQRAASLVKSDPYAAYDFVASAMIAFPDNAALTAVSADLPPRTLAKLRNEIEGGRLSAARETLRSARARFPGHPLTSKLADALEARMRGAERAYERYAQGVRRRTLSRASERRAAFAAVRELWSDNPEFRRVAYRERRAGECTADLAGKGRERDGVCFDLIAEDVKGMPLVVVPKANGVDHVYAIGKYETSIADFNVFCQRSGECRPIETIDPKLPVTGVTREQAEHFARWLSERASAQSGDTVVYRLPTDAEWRNAAAAAGERATKGINCRPAGTLDPDSGLLGRTGDGHVVLGTPVGRSPVSVIIGEENGWGVVNPAGNVQEWVVTAQGLAARGGAYTDKVSRCTVAFSRHHDGGADARTGFRLLRELN